MTHWNWSLVLSVPFPPHRLHINIQAWSSLPAAQHDYMLAAVTILKTTNFTFVWEQTTDAGAHCFWLDSFCHMTCVFRQICWPIHTISRLWIDFIYSWSPGDMNLNVWESEKDNTWNWFRVFHQGSRCLFHLLIGIQANTSFYFLSHWCVSRHSSEQTALDLVTEDYKTKPKKKKKCPKSFYHLFGFVSMRTVSTWLALLTEGSR